MLVTMRMDVRPHRLTAWLVVVADVFTRFVDVRTQSCWLDLAITGLEHRYCGAPVYVHDFV